MFLPKNVLFIMQRLVSFLTILFPWPIALRKMYETFGLSSTEALQALSPLIQGTLANLQKVGLPDALTGPISRGDISTIQSHAKALAGFTTGEAELYRLLGLYTLQIARQKDSITEQQAIDLAISLRNERSNYD